MSDLTKCNYCTLALMKQVAEARGIEVIVGTDEYGWVSARFSDEDKPSAHFMTLTESCVC